MKEKVLLGAAALLLISGCTTQSVVPVPHEVAACEVCVTPDASDRKVAYTATLNALRQKGFTVREVPAGATGSPARRFPGGIWRISPHQLSTSGSRMESALGAQSTMRRTGSTFRSTSIRKRK